MRALTVLTALAATLSPACAAPREELPFKRLPPRTRLEVQSTAPGLAPGVLVTTLIEPEGLLPLRVMGRRAYLEAGDPSLLDVRVRFEDFPGRGPVSSARSVHELLEYGADGEARPGQPLARPFTVELDPLRDALARRVVVSARLFVVDLTDDEGRSGSLALEFAPTKLETFRRPARRGTGAGGVLAALGDPDADELFLAAVTTPAAGREEVVGRLVAELPRLDGDHQEAAFAALLYLTGESHGRSEYRWQAWWDARRR